MPLRMQDIRLEIRDWKRGSFQKRPFSILVTRDARDL